MRRSSIISAITLVLLAFTVDSGHCISIEAQLQNIARETRKSLPMQIGDEVQATNVVAVGKTILNTYNFTKKKLALGNLNNVKAFYYNSSVNASCSNPDVLQTLRYGVSVVYEYYDVDNIFVMKFTIDQHTCRGFK